MIFNSVFLEIGTRYASADDSRELVYHTAHFLYFIPSRIGVVALIRSNTMPEYRRPCLSVQSGLDQNVGVNRLLESDVISKLPSDFEDLRKFSGLFEEADAGWHEEENDPTPFIRYMLQVILACYIEFEERVGLMAESGSGSTAYDVVKRYTEEKIGKFIGADVVVHCPSVGRSSVLAALKRLTEEGLIIRTSLPSWRNRLPGQAETSLRR